MSDLISILNENEDVNLFYENEDMKEVYEAAQQAVEMFHNFLPMFIHNYRDRFIAESGELSDYMKNIRTYAAAATAQFLAEVNGQIKTVADIVLAEVMQEVANAPSEDDYI